MDCATENLISCRKGGVQYVGETSQKLCSQLNNCRNGLKTLANLYDIPLQSFSSDGHSENDISVMPI